MISLKEAERSGDTADLVTLFHDDAEIANLTSHLPGLAGPAADHDRGHDGHSPNAYWKHYLAAFARVASELRHEVFDDGRTAVLEWISAGELPNGTPVSYCGVTILEHEDDKIRRLRVYYDSAALLPHATRVTNPLSRTVGIPPITNQATS